MSKENDEERKRFLKDVGLGDDVVSEEIKIEEAKEEVAPEVLEEYKSMKMSVLRKFYRTEMLKRRQCWKDYIAQQKFCKEVREHMKQLTKKA